jgi:3-dehydroquinate synthase class II
MVNGSFGRPLLQICAKPGLAGGLMQIRHALKALQKINQAQNTIALSKATVSEVASLGLGERVCVDLCDNLVPGEGMLVGNFCRGLFLVHSEV